jgi:hypothetical protein
MVLGTMMIMDLEDALSESMTLKLVRETIRLRVNIAGLFEVIGLVS